ncbi:ATP-binding protein [Halomonas sp. Bachu 37]|uniref:ATP-binding protein n=1 Tax=Halomonas kashgarensis TaxID=3084920 RepID=UPI003217A047
MSNPPSKPLAVREIQETATLSLAAAQTLINRSYLAELEQYPVQASDTSEAQFSRAADVRIFHIERIVQANKQSVLESTTAAYTALGAAGYAVFMLLNSDGQQTELYLGTRGEPGKMLGHNSGELLRETFKGHFPGSALRPLPLKETNHLLDSVQEQRDNPSACVTSVTGVPALSTDNREHFMQGLERFIDAAEGRAYQAIILAEPVSSQSLDLIRAGYEQVATQLSPLLKQQLSFGEQESDSVGLNISKSLSESLGKSLGLTETKGTTETTGTSTTETTGRSESHSAPTTAAKTTSITAGAAAVGTALFPGIGTGVGLAVGFGAQAIATAFSSQKTTGTTHSTAYGRNESHSINQSTATSQTSSSTQTTGVTDSRSLNKTLGSSKQVSIEATDKSIEQLLRRVDHHLERIDEAKTYGGWNAAAYFIGDSQASSESLASIFLGLIRGSKSSHEDFALSTWNSEDKKNIIGWLATFSHPQLKTNFSKQVPITYLTPATLVSGKELAIQLSLPRSSTSTVSVVTTETFGRKVQRLDDIPSDTDAERSLTLGKLRHLWENLPQNITLNLNHLTSHVFVSGSTGSGKSNTLYGMLEQISAADIPFLVVEPAKGEYKNVFGQRTDVRVFGTNPNYTELLRINPFRFPSGIHVLEHIDRLIEIFNICWPMYAAMPAVLKDATLRAYQDSGWDLDGSTNRYGNDSFPSFVDLLHALERVVEDSAYSQELKGNYIGSLSTRVKSLANGLNGKIFTDNEVGDEVLFDSRVIVDLSRVGSSETKALIMGLLVMRLSEYRMAQGGMNQPLRHVTVLEEAHNILQRSPDSGSEGAGVAAKAVEMLTNAIAEMRTYGEGFIIVDQSPNAVDIAAIRNTNTKIILRLPEEADRRLIGKSVALRDEQLDEVARLPKGVAVVYQNDWLEPVLCQVEKFSITEQPYRYQPSRNPNIRRQNFNHQVINLLLSKRIRDPSAIDLGLIEKGLNMLPLSSASRIALSAAVSQRKHGEPLELWKPQGFAFTAQLIVDVLGCRNHVSKAIQTADNYQELQQKLDAMLQERMKEPSGDLLLAAQQCLMKDYSLQHENHVAIYSAWRAELEAEDIA